MRTPLVISAALPLALALASCGSNADEAPTDDTAAVDVNLPNTQPDYPLVPADARSNVDYAGTYRQSLPDGRERTITLRNDDTYMIRDENGVETTGTYNWYSDNSRILIKRNGQNEVYAIADGALYRLPDENAPTTGQMTEEQTYRRVLGPGGPMGASGSPDTAGTTTGDTPAQ